MQNKRRLVVIGNGMAGGRLVEEVLARGGDGLFEIVVFGDDPAGNYNRTLLSGVLAGTNQPKDILINAPAWYAEKGVKLHSGVRVGWIDRLARKVYAPGEIVEPYDTLVIATGSTPIVPSIKGLYGDLGSFREGIHVFRTLGDCEGIIRCAANGRRAAVIGGGLQGLEAACGLMSRGLEVHVVHLTSHLMETQVDLTAGAMLQRGLQQRGIQVHLEKTTAAILGDDLVSGLAFEDGSTLGCDLVVLAIGTRPNVDLAKQAGLTVQRGIIVHDDLSCRNDADICAIGDCAEHRGRIFGLVGPAWEQARVLADRLTGANPQATYKEPKVSTRLKVMGVALALIGDSDSCREGDEVVTYAEPSRGVYVKLIVREGLLAGAIMLGDSRLSPRLLQAFQRGQPAPRNRAELLFPITGDAGSPNLADLSTDAPICNCNGVSKGAIMAAVKAGYRTLEGLCQATRAGTGCGSCKPQVRALLELASEGALVDDPAAQYYVPGVPMTKRELVAAAQENRLRSVSAVLEALGGGTDDPDSKAALASLLRTVWGEDYEDERDARHINDRVHANIQKDGAFSVVPRIYGGVATPEELRRIADVAEKYRVPVVKITGGQRIALLGIPKEELPAVWRDLGMPSGHAYTKAFRTCKTCVGADFCRYGLGDSLTLGVKIERRWRGIESPHKMKLACSGCPRNSAEATTKDVGAVAIEGGRWEIFVGGAAGSRVRRGDILCVAQSHDEVLASVGRFIQFYRENARYQERTCDFVERVGIQELRRLLVEDAEGICDGLDAEITATADRYVDPWQEADAPVHPNQFAGVLAGVE